MLEVDESSLAEAVASLVIIGSPGCCCDDAPTVSDLRETMTR
jgi:hypothetical protein